MSGEGNLFIVRIYCEIYNEIEIFLNVFFFGFRFVV